MRRSAAKVLPVLCAFLLGACGLLDPTPGLPPPTLEPTPTEPPPSPTPEPHIGSVGRPLGILFSPARGSSHSFPTPEALASALRDVTGLAFEVSAASSHREAIEEICAFPETTIGFLPAVDYVLARKACAVDVGAKSINSGYEWSAGMVFVPRSSEFETLADLDGRAWAFPSATSLDSYLYPLHMFEQADLAPSRTLAAGSDAAAVAAVYDGRADFGTAFYVPLRVDGKPADWHPGDPPDVPEDLVRFCTTTADNKAILCANLNVRDARREVRAEFSDVVQKVRIVATTPRLPNDAVCFGAYLPAELRQLVLAALFDLAAGDSEGFAELMAPYGWTGLLAASDTDFAAARLAVDAAGIGLEDLDP